MDDTELLATAARWRDDDIDPETKAEIDALLARGDAAAIAELRERFAAPLEFGTAGLRGLIGAGPGRMNLVTVMQASAAVARQLLADVPDAAGRGVVIGRDARRNSDRFARIAAEVIAAHGLRVYWVPEPAPTPVVAFLGRDKGAAGVVIVTASHNPPEYNGFKVYGPTASQIVPPQDARIRDMRDAIVAVADIQRVDFTTAIRDGRIIVVNKHSLGTYLDAIDAQCLVSSPPPAQVSVVTTALHGVGHTWVADALARRGHRHVFPVIEQAAPDGRFPTVRFPNPEEKGALDLALALARDKFAELVLANDPDTDRLCVAVRDASQASGYRVLTGNELGLLLADWIMTRGPERPGWPDKPLVVCSLVSTMMLEPLAKARGVAYAEVLTGFKWIWHLALERKASTGETFVFGFEEALGYCVNPQAVRDKDGVGAAQSIMEFAAFEKARGRDLLARLEDIAVVIGASFTDQVTVVLPGLDGIARIGRIMARVARGAAGGVGRTDRPEPRLAGPDAEAAGMVRADVLTWWLADGARIIARPSGTEPKLKVYLETKAATRADAIARAGELAAIIRAAVDQVAESAQRRHTMSSEMEEGFRMEMAERIREENELKAKLAILEQALEAPEAKLEKAKQILIKAKAHYDACLDEVKPLRSDKTLIEGELVLIEEKKSKLRQEAAYARGGGGIRPGTGQLVEQMNAIAGDAEEHAMRKDVKAAAALDALEELKRKLGK